MAEICELRTILETAAVRLVCERATDAQLARQRDSVEFTYVYHDRHSYSDFLDRNLEFDRAIAVAAGNQRLVDALTRHLNELTRVFHLGLDLRDSAEEMRAEHLALTEALLARAGDRAEAVSRSQIARSQHRVVAALVGSSGSVPSNHLAGDVQIK